MPQPKTSEALADRKLADKADQSRQHAAEGERYKTVPARPGPALPGYRGGIGKGGFYLGLGLGCGRLGLARKQLGHGNAQHARQRREQRDIGAADPALPFTDGLVGYAQGLGELLLR